MLLGEKRNRESYPAKNTVKTIVTSLAKYIHWYNSGMDAMGLSRQFLVGFKPAPQEGILALVTRLKAYG